MNWISIFEGKSGDENYWQGKVLETEDSLFDPILSQSFANFGAAE